MNKKLTNDFIQKVKNKKVNIKGKSSVRLDLEPNDFEFLIKLLKLSTNIEQLKETINVIDEEADFYLNMISQARKSIQNKGAGRKDYQEALKILNAKLPKRGKRPTYSEKELQEILEYHKSQIRELGKGKIKLTSQQKILAVKAVNKKYFPMSQPDSTRIFLYRKGAKNLPGGGF